MVVTQTKIQDVLNVEDMKFWKFPPWIVELAENHKSNWIPDSKGGEPNHKTKE